jgi:hypothetical protein
MLNVKRFNTISKWAILNLFLFAIVDGFFTFVGIKTYLPTILILLSLPLIINYFRINKLSAVDIYFIAIILYIVLISMIAVITHELSVDNAFTGFRWTVWSMFFFFLGKDRTFANNKIFDNMLPVLSVFFVIVLLLHILSPVWYIALKTIALNNLYLDRDFDLSEANDFSRLTGFSTHPYQVSYGAFLFISYAFYKQISVHKTNPKLVIRMIIAFIALFLAAQRGPIMFVFISIITFSTFSLFSKNKLKSVFVLFISLLIFCVLFSVRFADYFSWGAFLDSKLQTVNTSLFFDRFDMFSQYFELDLFGKGLNYFMYNRTMEQGVTDNEWIKLLMEIGIMGVSLIVIFVLMSLMKGIRNFKYNIFEIVIILCYLMSMAGTNSLTGGLFTTFPMIFWFCLGRIYNQYLYRWKKENLFIKKKKNVRKESKSHSILSPAIPPYTRE